MAGGFAKDGAVQDQIDATIEDAVSRARDQIPRGKSLTNCEECDAVIPEARRAAVPEPHRILRTVIRLRKAGRHPGSVELAHARP